MRSGLWAGDRPTGNTADSDEIIAASCFKASQFKAVPIPAFIKMIMSVVFLCSSDEFISSHSFTVYNQVMHDGDKISINRFRFKACTVRRKTRASQVLRLNLIIHQNIQTAGNMTSVSTFFSRLWKRLLIDGTNMLLREGFWF